MRSSTRSGGGSAAALPGAGRQVTRLPAHLTIALVFAGCFGCGTNTTSDAEQGPVWFETDRQEYRWEPIAHGVDRGLRVEIPVTFTNHTDSPVAIPPCRDLRDRRRWVRVWALEGDFRLVWPGVYPDSAYKPLDAALLGEPLPPEVHRSNTFRITMP